jgi:Asp-tRNA(Asn)/Glu-tRNA(Gln) amidotransferase C subunit
MSPDMPKAELQRVAQGIDASGLQLDEHELEQLLKKVSKLLQVRRNIDAVTEMRLPYAAAVAAAESQRRDEESGPETPHDSNDV